MNLQFLRPKESENADVGVAVKKSTEKSADPISERKIVSVIRHSALCCTSHFKYSIRFIYCRIHKNRKCGEAAASDERERIFFSCVYLGSIQLFTAAIKA